jgi:sulfur-carrier protein
VRVLLFAALRELAGASSIEVDSNQAPNVGALRALLSERYGPEFDRIAAAGSVVVDGETSRPGRLLEPDDEVAVLPPVSGGSRRE